MIGYYDRLSGSFNGDKLIGEVTPEKPLEQLKIFTKEQSPKPKLIVSKIPTKPTAIATSINNKSLPKINSNLYSHQHHPSTKTLQIISPNVHRMISSHQTTTETITNSYVLNNSNTLSSHLSRSGSHNLQVNKRQIGGDKSSVNLPLSSQRRIFGNKPTGIAIPLTKNLSKISQSSGLVDSIEPIVHTITDNNCNNEELFNKSSELTVDSEKTPTNCDHNFNYENIDYLDDDDDNIQNVLNKTSELINNLLSGSGNDNDKNITLDIHESTKSNNFNDRVLPPIDEMSRHKYKLHVNSTETDEEDAAQADEKPLVEKLVTNLKTFAKSLDNVTEIDTKQLQQKQHHVLPPTASPKLTYSRAKLLSNLNVDVTAISASDGKLNTSPSTKHRPLSAASISSSSSSTSTGSSSNSFGNEILTGTNRQYLASIESLADHSENEVNHPSLTMCERAALEIVESEKSYVQDLGQIIKGYLQDWKERACLKTDELETLFSNIQEIYEFNSSLLEKLIESQNDPLRISKCFIDSHESFDVYTIYW